MIEDPTYWLAIPILERHNPEIERVPVDEYGMQVDLLEQKLKQGLHVRYLPNHNFHHLDHIRSDLLV